MSETLKRVKETLSGVSLSVRWWTPSRAARPQEQEAAAVAKQSRRVKVRKEVIDTKHPAWQSLVSCRTAIRSWFDYVTIPYVVTGQRLFLRERRQEIWDKVEVFATDLRTRAVALDDVRDELIAEAQESLGDAHDDSLFPVRWSDVFGIEIREHSIEPPSYLAYSNAEEYAREMQRTLSDLGTSMQRFESQCMAQMGESAARLAANLDDNGRVMSSNVESFQKVFARVAQMKFEGTAIFKQALGEAQEILDGVGADELRHNRGLRTETRGRLQTLMARFHGLQSTVAAKHQEESAPV